MKWKKTRMSINPESNSGKNPLWKLKMETASLSTQRLQQSAFLKVFVNCEKQEAQAEGQ